MWGTTGEYPTPTTNFGTFEGDNGSAAESLTNLGWELDPAYPVTPAYFGGATWAIDCGLGAVPRELTATGGFGLQPDTTYKVTVFAKDCTICPLPAGATADTLSNRQSIYVQIGTPSTPKAICSGGDGYPFDYEERPTNGSTINYGTTPLYPAPGAGPYLQYPLAASGWYLGTAGSGGLANGGGNTSADQGHPVEYFFGIKGPTNATASGTKTQDYFLSVPIMVDFTTANTAGGIIGEDPTGTGAAFTNGICFYNVVTRNPINWPGCPTALPLLTTGALTQGTLAIWVRLISVGQAAPAAVTTNYTIIYRATSSDPWQQATPTAVVGHPSPTLPGVAVGVETLTTPGANAEEEVNALYFFDTPGEYVVRNNGFVVTPADPDAHAFMIDFWDAREGTITGILTECADCTGPS